VDGGRLKAPVATRRLSVTVDVARLAEPETFLICVPTPLTPQREPDMRYVASTARQIGAALHSITRLKSSSYR